MRRHLTLIIGGIGLLAGCEEEQPPRSTMEFLDNPIMLEAAMVRCSQDRAATRYDAECVNARQAVSQIEAKEEVVRQAEFDARSKSKRQALRRTQEAAAQARRRAADAERLRIEAEYLAQFGVAPPINLRQCKWIRAIRPRQLFQTLGSQWNHHPGPVKCYLRPMAATRPVLRSSRKKSHLQLISIRSVMSCSGETKRTVTRSASFARVDPVAEMESQSHSCSAFCRQRS